MTISQPVSASEVDVEYALARMVKARSTFVLGYPFYATLALQLRLMPELSLRRLSWTDGVHIGFSVPHIMSGNYTIDQLMFVLAHEVLHCVFKHHTRRGTRHPKLWNMAADYVVNLMLKAQGFELLDGVVLDDRFQGMTVEQVYAALVQENPELPDELEGGDGGDGDDTGDTDPVDDDGQFDEVRDYPGPDSKDGSASESEMAAHEREWDLNAVSAAQAAKAQGKTPAGLERLVSEIVAPRVNWRDQLARFVTAQAKNDYTWAVPNRRHLHRGLYLPSQLSMDALDRLIIAVDTSGSVTQEELTQFATEISQILEDFDTEVTVVYVDEEVAGVETFKSEDQPIKLNAKGGGGTNFQPPFEWVEQEGLVPSCFIYLTDLQCSRYPNEPYYPVLWVLTLDCSWQEEAPFGETIKMK